MIKPDDVENLAELFGALGSETRINILRELQERALCVGALAMLLDMTQSAISQHLKVLRNAGLVESDKRGSYVHYSLAENARDRCRKALVDILPESQNEEGNTK
ncbi:MAG: metalloregulator ArsR/SmtB family transcription factor [Armatimonadota bacterium]